MPSDTSRFLEAQSETCLSRVICSFESRSEGPAREMLRRDRGLAYAGRAAAGYLHAGIQVFFATWCP
jgi:hypothetical protein